MSLGQYGHFDYDYDKATGVKGLDFRPGSKLHDKIVSEIFQRCTASKRNTDAVSPEWRETDKMLEGFMPEGEFDTLRKLDDPRKPVVIVVPMMFMMREMMLAYFWQAFFSEATIQRYRGMGDAMATVRAGLLERINMIQASQFKERLRILNMCDDGIKYGRGTVMTNWKKLTAPQLRTEALDPLTAMQLNMRGMGAASGDEVRYFSENKVYAEGTELKNIDQYQAFFDPDVSPDKIQDSEYFGFVYSTNVFGLMKEENDPENRMFNAKYCRELAKGGGGLSANWNRTSGRGERYGGEIQNTANENTNKIHLTPFLWQLIPSEWGLGDSDTPEVWQFIMAGDRIIVKANPIKEMHGKLPLACCAPNADGHSIAPIGHLLTILNSQKMGNWLLKSVADATCTILNGLIFVDERVNLKQMMNPSHGKFVTFENSAYGDNAGPPVHYFTPPNPTENHIKIADYLGNLSKLGYEGEAGLPDRPGAAVGAAAANRVTGRLGLIASIIDEQALHDIAHIKAYNTMQFMGEEVFVPIAGSYEEELRLAYGVSGAGAQIQVSPWDIGNFGFQVLPYTSRMGGLDDTSAMSEVLKTLSANPQVMQELGGNLRTVDLFLEFFKKLGFTDIEKFRRYAGDSGMQLGIQAQSPEQIQQGVQSGNLVPMGAM